LYASISSHEAILTHESRADTALFFDETFNETKIPLIMLEKDYWAVWTLERLFAPGALLRG